MNDKMNHGTIYLGNIRRVSEWDQTNQVVWAEGTEGS